MKISFSTLACPEWTLTQVLELAAWSGYDGIELRFLEGEDSLWKLPVFRGARLQAAKCQISASGLAISCLDTSCRFDSPDQSEREKWIEEGERMVELAVDLGAPGIRVFGDRIHPEANREATTGWIIESLATLAHKIHDSGVEIWLETHGDFSCSSDVHGILSQCPEIRVVWDPASAYIRSLERPLDNGLALERYVGHTHIKDMQEKNGQWVPVLTGEGEFPLNEVRSVMEKIGYAGFLSFEWEKKWHPSIENAEVAVPHFASWFRENWLRTSRLGKHGEGGPWGTSMMPTA